MLYPLNIKHYLALIALILCGYIFTATQKYYLPEFLRPEALLLVIISLFLAFFFYVKPKTPNQLSKSLCLILAIAALILILIQHVIIFHDFIALLPKLAVVFAVAIISPFISGKIYKVIIGTKN